MIIDKIKEIVNQSKQIKIKMYSLEYTIKQLENCVVIYANLYPHQVSKYDNLDELFNNFTIYNETITENLDRLTIVE